MGGSKYPFDVSLLMRWICTSMVKPKSVGFIVCFELVDHRVKLDPT